MYSAKLNKLMNKLRYTPNDRQQRMWFTRGVPTKMFEFIMNKEPATYAEAVKAAESHEAIQRELKGRANGDLEINSLRRKSKKDMKCHYCGIKGHFRHECRKRKADMLKAKQGKQGKQGNDKSSVKKRRL